MAGNESGLNMRKLDLERMVAELKAENDRLSDENSRLRHGKPVFCDGRNSYVITGRIDHAGHAAADNLRDIVSRLCGEGVCLASESAADDRLLNAHYKMAFFDGDAEISEVPATYLFDYNYDDDNGTDINAVWLLERVGK